MAIIVAQNGSPSAYVLPMLHSQTSPSTASMHTALPPRDFTLQRLKLPPSSKKQSLSHAFETACSPSVDADLTQCAHNKQSGSSVRAPGVTLATATFSERRLDQIPSNAGRLL